MNHKIHLSLLVAISSLALVAIGCDNGTVTAIDAGGHPDLGTHDAGTDTGTSVDMGMTVDIGMLVDGGPVDMGTVVDMGSGHYTDAGCYEGTPIIMTDFLNRCTTRSTPASGVTGTGVRSTLILADGGVPPIP